jgi:flagellar biosynthesis/type III secretory pathway M-ring protein FliF/YscJ
MKNKKLTDTAPQKEGELFAMLWLLDYQQYLYYDKEDDKDIAIVEQHLKENNIPYKKGRHNRLHLTTLV